MLRSDLEANRHRAKGRFVMVLFRLGQAMPRPLRRLYQPLYYVVVDMVLGVSLPLTTVVGAGFQIVHGQGLVISWRSEIGARCEFHQGVTLGEVRRRAPVVGNDVLIGANAVVLGGVRIGDGARIGAGAVVTKDVPDGCTAVGNPARVLGSSISSGRAA
jgi:putative colanic acid biosynthesis acetyltransferase WcaB